MGGVFGFQSSFQPPPLPGIPGPGPQVGGGLLPGLLPGGLPGGLPPGGGPGKTPAGFPGLGGFPGQVGGQFPGPGLGFGGGLPSLFEPPSLGTPGFQLPGGLPGGGGQLTPDLIGALFGGNVPAQFAPPDLGIPGFQIPGGLPGGGPQKSTIGQGVGGLGFTQPPPGSVQTIGPQVQGQVAGFGQQDFTQLTPSVGPQRAERDPSALDPLAAILTEAGVDPSLDPGRALSALAGAIGRDGGLSAQQLSNIAGMFGQASDLFDPFQAAGANLLARTTPGGPGGPEDPTNIAQVQLLQRAFEDLFNRLNTGVL